MEEFKYYYYIEKLLNSYSYKKQSNQENKNKNIIKIY